MICNAATDERLLSTCEDTGGDPQVWGIYQSIGSTQYLRFSGIVFFSAESAAEFARWMQGRHRLAYGRRSAVVARLGRLNDMPSQVRSQGDLGTSVQVELRTARAESDD